MQVIRDSALRQPRVQHREHVHARANWQDVAPAHRRVEAAHYPGEAVGIDDAVEDRVGQKNRDELRDRDLAQISRHL